MIVGLGFVWAFAKATALPLALRILKVIPWQVWAILAGVIAIWYYGHWKEKQGRQACELAVQVATEKEVSRVKGVNSKVTEELYRRALAAEERNRQLAKEVDSAVKQVEDAENKAKAANKGKQPAVVCLPGSFLDRVRRR